MERRPLIAANWKMNKTIAEAEAFVDAFAGAAAAVSGRDVVVFPPFLALPGVARRLEGSPVSVGAQDLFWEASGAFTGEVSGAMIRDAGGTYVLVGHSERRHVIGESDAVVARKLRAALDAGLVPVLCVGETLEEREAGCHEAVVRDQVRAAFDGVDADGARRVVVAYEPVWAIGTGRTATPDDAEAMHGVVRAALSETAGPEAAEAARILYGGSVKPGNAAGLLARPGVDGALVGGAALDPESFLAIVRAGT